VLILFSWLTALCTGYVIGAYSERRAYRIMLADAHRDRARLIEDNTNLATHLRALLDHDSPEARRVS